MFVAAAKMWWRFSTVTLRLVTILAARPTHLHGCHHHPACKVIHCLGNGLDQHGNQVLLLVRTSLLLTWHCHLWSACWELPALVGDVDEELGRSLPVLATCPSEGFPASSNSQDWQQFLIPPPFAFLAITMVGKAPRSGQSASWFWDPGRRHAMSRPG